MKFRDYHVHLEEGPFSIDWIEKFLDEGSKKGVTEIGFSEHGHRFKEALSLTASDGFRGEWVKTQATESIEEYIEVIERAKSKGFPVKLGLELDYIPEYEDDIRAFARFYPFDYVLGGIHWLGDFGFDHPDLIDEWKTKDVDKVYDEYFDTLLSAVESGIYDCMAHPDVIKVFGHRPKEDVSIRYEQVSKSISRMGICAEVSTAGLRKPVMELYPSCAFMESLKKYNIPIMINSDAHIPEDVGRDFETAQEFVKRFGYDRLCYFTDRRRLIYSC